MRPRPQPPPEGAARVLVVVGPTASGKSALALELAERLGAEIVSADSQQVYRGLDVGTAKPTAEDRRRVPHHLLDVIGPTEALNAGAFARLADEAIADIVRRGKLPLVVGGTGLWIRALLLGIVAAPEVDPEIRAELEQRAAREGPLAMHAELSRIDPQTAAATPAQNLVRVVRALELYRLTGEKPSALRARHGFGQLRLDARVLGLCPLRAELYRRIDARARQMFARGLVDEVRGLLAQGLEDAPALRALGYPQAVAVAKGRTGVEEAVLQLAQETRHYAKRQLTWFRSDPLVQWLDWPVDAAALAVRP
jgi:tRNA dimethylallyltransferase